MAVRPSNALMTVEDFLIACPEFEDTDLQLINDALQEAGEELDPCIWGILLASAHKYKTAHALASSPMGQNARLIIAPDGTTTYIKKFKELLLMVTMGGRVA